MNKKLFFALTSILYLLSGLVWNTAITVMAQDAGTTQVNPEEAETRPETQSNKPVARNAWEEIYFRIAGSYSAESIMELLRSMELESDQEGLAPSYALILHDQIVTYTTHKRRESMRTDQILLFLLEKVSILADNIKEGNPEVINTIGVNLIPSLGYSALQGKANSTLGYLGASDYSANILQRLEDINLIVSTAGTGSNYLGLNYAAQGCLDALKIFKVPESYPVLLQITTSPFDSKIRSYARLIMNELLEEKQTDVQEQFLSYVSNSSSILFLDQVMTALRDDEFNKFEAGAEQKLYLALMTRMNQSTWVPSARSAILKREIMRKAIDEILGQELDNDEIRFEASAQLEKSYYDTSSTNIRLLSLLAIGKLKSENGLEFLQDEIIRIGILQRSGYLNYQDERLLRQLLYALRISEDTGEKTISALRDVAISPYPSSIRQIAKDLIAEIS